MLCVRRWECRALLTPLRVQKGKGGAEVAHEAVKKDGLEVIVISGVTGRLWERWPGTGDLKACRLKARYSLLNGLRRPVNPLLRYVNHATSSVVSGPFEMCRPVHC